MKRPTARPKRTSTTEHQFIWHKIIASTGFVVLAAWCVGKGEIDNAVLMAAAAKVSALLK